MGVTSYAQIGLIGPTPLLLGRINDETATSEWMDRYGLSKFANLLFTRSLQSRLGSDYYVNYCHPGQVCTKLYRTVSRNGFFGYVIRILMLFLYQPVIRIGALTQLYHAARPEIEEKIHGEYYVSIAKQNIDKITPLALNSDLAEELWNEMVDEEMKVEEQHVPPGSNLPSHRPQPRRRCCGEDLDI